MSAPVRFLIKPQDVQAGHWYLCATCQTCLNAFPLLWIERETPVVHDGLFAFEGISCHHCGAKHRYPLGSLDRRQAPFAKLWGLSPDTVVRWFQDLPGVLKLSTAARRGKRQRVELRIPFSLAMQVYQERTR
jgi:hypothetical protein